MVIRDFGNHVLKCTASLSRNPESLTTLPKKLHTSCCVNMFFMLIQEELSNVLWISSQMDIGTQRLICLLHLALAGGAILSFLRTKILYAASYQIIK